MKTMVWVCKSVITCRLYTENRDKVIKTVLGDRTHKNVQVTCQVRRGHAAQCDAWTNYPSSHQSVSSLPHHFPSPQRQRESDTPRAQ